MPFLTIAGITVPVAIDGMNEEEGDEIGNDSRAYAGNLRTTVRDVKRAWTVTTKSVTATDYNTLRNAVITGAHVACSGDALGGATFTCRVRIKGGPFKKVKGTFRRVATLHMRQV